MPRRHLAGAFALYLVVALLDTWPLARSLASDLPWDLGDPLLNCWILGTNAEKLTRALGGDPAGLRDFWDARIFHPEPLTLAYSEHLLPQTLQVLPLYAATKNLILGYNLLFLSTFVLAALAMYLLALDLTGSRPAALLAGLVFGFSPYRVEQLSHLQVLSSQWMPFALLGLRRYVHSGRLAPLAGGAAAIVVQGLSCGYYLLYFSPFAALYAAWEMVQAGQVRNVRRWAGLAAAGLLAAALVAPFLVPYLELHKRGTLVRAEDEVQLFSADVYSYLTATEGQRAWAWLQVYPKPEGGLFPSLTPLLLAALAVAVAIRQSHRPPEDDGRRWPQLLARAALIALALQALAALLIVAGTGHELSTWIPGLRLRRLDRPLFGALLSLAILLWASPRARGRARELLRAPITFPLFALALAFWLSLGPDVTSLGHSLSGASLYRWLYEYVPGFQGVRVPARFAMVFTLFLSVLAGWGFVALQQARGWGPRAAAALGALFLLESTPAPIVLNDVWREYDLKPPPPRVFAGEGAPAIYDAVRALPGDAVLLELPFGSFPYELRYMFYATQHGRRLSNGFSGALPASYQERRQRLRALPALRDQAWDAIRTSGATHVIVHEAAWRRGKGPKMTEWLEALGLRRLTQAGPDVLLELPQR